MITYEYMYFPKIVNGLLFMMSKINHCYVFKAIASKYFQWNLKNDKHIRDFDGKNDGSF